MQGFRYLSDVVTLEYDAQKCVGCGTCAVVCPHQVFVLKERKAELADRNACIECGACAKNCAPGAITVTPGVGCATYIIQTWFGGKGKSSGGCC